uniref:Uncharacterized protein n=1 Tax=viral metagenome TaxID=1070528 RepID=A0A6H1ZRD0_9ZZZZ
MSPVYDFVCAGGHVNELRKGYDDEVIACPECEQPAVRTGVYLDQYIFGDTCARNQRRAEVPRDEKRYDVTLMQEAGAEIEYAHAKAEEYAQKSLPRPNLYAEAIKRAKAVLAGQAPRRAAETRFKHRTN